MTTIYIDTEKLEKPIPAFGIICSGMREEKHSLRVENYKHPVDSNRSFESDSSRILPEVVTYSFFIADNPQTWLEQLEFIGSAEFWKGLAVEYGRVYEEITLKDSGLRSGLENSFSSFIFQTLKDMRGYEVITTASTGEIKNMKIEDIEAVRTNTQRGMSFTVTLSEVETSEKEVTQKNIERTYKPKKSDTATTTKSAEKKDVGKLEQTTSILTDITGVGATR